MQILTKRSKTEIRIIMNGITNIKGIGYQADQERRHREIEWYKGTPLPFPKPSDLLVKKIHS